MHTVCLGYAEFIKQYEIQSSTRENDTINRQGRQRMCEATAGVTQHTILQQIF